MPKNCILTLDPKVVEKATVNAHKLGKSLKEVIEDAIETTAAFDAEGPWVVERELEELDWAPSRVTLYFMRKSGRLTPGKHFKRQGRFIYYDRAALEREFKTEKAEAPDAVTAPAPVTVSQPSVNHPA